MLGIIGAMTEEVLHLKEAMEDVEIRTIATMDFYQGRLKGLDVVVVRSGIGKVNAAMCAQILADVYHADHVINTGIAGSLKAEINIGDIVLSTDALQHDMDAQAFGYEPGQIPRVDTLSFKADEKMIALAKECCEKVNPEIGVFTGRVVSGDQFISDKEKKKWLTDTFAGYCTEMEGAAIAQACYLNKIPFVILRVMSDTADGDGDVDYEQFFRESAKTAGNIVNNMLTILK